MWTFKCHLGLRNSRQTSVISSLHLKNGNIYVGGTDGKVVTSRYDFQSHEREFDYLESSDISEKINSIATFSSGTFHENIITCNEKSIKLWKVRPNLSTQDTLEMAYSPNDAAPAYRAECVKNIRNVHNYSINSVSVSSNEHFVLSSDYLRVYLWSTQNMSQCFNLIDSKPKRYEELEFVITRCLFRDSSVFGYGTTHGMVYVNDLRMSPRSTRVSSVSANKSSFYDDLTRAISDFKFFQENYLITRDLNTLAIYDLRNNKTEVKKHTLFETQESFLESILSRDTESDSFSLGLYGNNVVTGGYGGNVYVMSLDDEKIETICLDSSAADGAVEHCAMGDGQFVCAHRDKCYVYAFHDQ